MLERYFTEKDLSDIEQELKHISYLQSDKLYIKNELERLLKSEDIIIKSQKASIDKEKCNRLYIDFLKTEKSIYDAYERMGTKAYNKPEYKDFLKKHSINAMEYDLRSTINFLIKHKVFSIPNLVFLGALFCVPYFIKIAKTPDISLDSIPMSLVVAAFIGLIYGLYFLFFYVSQNIFLFRAFNSNSSTSKKVFITANILLFVIIAPFIVDEITSIKCLSLNTESATNWLFSICSILTILIFACMFLMGDKKEPSSCILSFLFVFMTDFIILLIAYYNHNDIFMIIVTGLLYVCIIGMRFLALFDNLLDYKFSFGLGIAFTVLFMIFLSGTLMRIAGIANYQTDFDIKKENIPEYVIGNINKCKNTQDKDIIKYTCISDEMSNSTVKFKNILVKVKSDGRYWLEVVAEDQNKSKEVVAKDQNKSKIDDYRFWISEKNIVN